MPRRVGSLDPAAFCALTLSKHLGEHLIAYTKTILNLVYALGSSLLLMLLGFATRRLLVFNFGNDITAASQVVDKLFNFFSIAEFGVGSVISYRLYEQIAAKDTEKISKYMSMYKWAYRAVGVVICVLAGIGALALPWIMPGVASIQTAYTVYLLNTISTLSGYFLVTRRLMYTCTQQGYLCTRIDFCFNVANYLARIAIALWLPNYILYFGVSILFNTGANLVVAARYKKDFLNCTRSRLLCGISRILASSMTSSITWFTACPTPFTVRPIPSSPAVWRAAL